MTRISRTRTERSSGPFTRGRCSVPFPRPADRAGFSARDRSAPDPRS